jgi:outer membrane lipoprotein SlyB
MEMQARRNTHPLLIIAAIAVTLFSLVGIGAVMGWIPTSTGQLAPAPASAQAQLSQAPEQGKSASSAPSQADAPAPVREKRPAPAVSHAKPKMAPAPEPRVVRGQPEAPATRMDSPREVAQAAPPAPVVRPVCQECGVVDSIREIEKEGDAKGGGAIGGAVAGGVLGHQMGNGRGQDVMTVLGAVGGALAGHQIEKRVKKVKEYQVVVRFEDGATRSFTQATEPAWRAGDRVRYVNGALQSNG